ncbi:MAG TPA: pyruvate ferredoxin oxidoreductase [Dehalococcoidia bacterium]|nr:pyruvate ferredoxin oxidoreductase [Dehalococcoidia bacterium]
MVTNHQIRLCGFGGQGIILAGFIIGQAATVYEGINAVFTQDYGPEARGGSCRADVIISDEIVNYPYVEYPSVLVAMSQAGYDKYYRDIGPDIVVIIDEDLVTPDPAAPNRILAIPAWRFARELGRVAVANVVMLGFFAGATDYISPDSIKNSILASVPKGTEELNTKAFERGFEHASEKKDQPQ